MTSTATSLIAYQNVADPIRFMESMGRAIAKSRMFGCDNEEQGQVLAMACLCEQENPIAINRRYHIVEGKLSMRADAMLAELRARGGKHLVVERTADAAEIELHYDDQVYRERFTWEEAQAEPFVYRKDGVTLKVNWATPRARRQMLWARVVSEAVRTLCPEIVAGIYTPEEAGDFKEAVAKESRPVNVEELIVNSAGTRKPEGSETQEQGEVIDAEYEITDEKESVVATEGDQPDSCTADQRKEIGFRFEQLQLDDQQRERILEKRGVKMLRQLTRQQAHELIRALDAKIDEVTEKLSGQSRLPPETTAADVTSPAGQTLVDRIKTLLAGDRTGIELVKHYLTKQGKAKIADLSHEDATKLCAALEMDALQQFMNDTLGEVPF